jgi:ankyrin repeat protein
MQEDRILNLALRGAIDAGEIDAIDKLVDKGADLTTATSNGRTALHALAEDYPNAGVALFQKLLAKGVDIESRDQEGCTPLHRAALRGNILLMDDLIQNRANVNAADSRGFTPLHMAASGLTGPAITELALNILIANGANLDAKNHDGKTPFEHGRHFWPNSVPRTSPAATSDLTHSQEGGDRAIKPRGSHSENACPGATSPENLDRDGRNSGDREIG